MLMVLISENNNEKITGIIEKDVRKGMWMGWSSVAMCNRFCCQAGYRGTLTEGTAVSGPFAAG